MKMPKERTKRWKEIVDLGCGGHYDHEGEFGCEHGYEWDCDYCPVFIEKMRK